MKKIFLLSIALCSIAAVSAQQRPAAKVPARNATEDTIQYTLGVYMMQQLFAKTGFVVQDPVLFKKAIDDYAAMQKDPKKKLMIDPATAESRLISYQTVYRQEVGRRLENMLFTEIKKQPNYNTLSNGVMYTVVKAGQGPIPGLRDTVILNVNSMLPDGTVIDDAAKTKQSYMTLTADMIAGLRDVMLKVREGSVFRAVIPAAQAYGERGQGNIPPNSALIYDVAVVGVRLAK